MNEPQLQQVPVADIVPTSDNQRKIDVKSEDFAELVASIAGGGVRVPVHVRPVSGATRKFELRAGGRRYRAAIAAGLETIPAIVHTGQEDTDAIDLTFIENKFRKDLKPMEEAAEIALLTERFGGDIKAIAGKVGKKERWVRLRANINANLIKPWKSIFLNIDKYPEFKSWSVKHLTLIARLPGTRQKQLLMDIEAYYFHIESCSVRDLEDFIAKELKLLGKAKWELDDQTLVPKAGACTNCEKRSGHQPMLWFDSDEQAAAGDQCLDSHCWLAKTGAWLARQAKELREKHPKLVYISKEYPNNVNAKIIENSLGDYLSEWKYKIVSKSTRGSVPAMYVFGKSAGKLTYVKVDAGSGQTGRVKGTPAPLKLRRKTLDAKRWAQVLIDLREKVDNAEVKDLVLDNNGKSTGMMALVALYGNNIPYHARVDVKQKEVEELIDSGWKKVLEVLWGTFKPTLDDLLTYNGPITQVSKEYIEQAKWISALVGADVKAMFKDVSKRKGFTEPKSWANLKTDGTPKDRD